MVSITGFDHSDCEIQTLRLKPGTRISYVQSEKILGDNEE